MNENAQVQLLKIIVSKTLFFDKYSLENVYQYPRISALKLKFFISSHFGLDKVKLSKVILLFYVLTGQRPKLLSKICNLRNIKRKKIVGLLLTVHQYSYFLSFLIQRQLPLVVRFFQSSALIRKSTFNFEVIQKSHDDDLLFQALKLPDLLKYQISLKSTSLVKEEHLRSLLIGFKIPCKE